ncbi:MAG: hypothetical protein IKR07_04765 [Oscillospiraceae bacterium]|nr:hypothetical protein [Oscillospiraceae bacterium]
MKKWIGILLVLCMLAGLAACGGKTEAPAATGSPAQASNSKPETESKPGAPAASTKGEVYDTGNFKVLVPDGWKAFPQHDVFNDDPDAMNPNIIQICKGATSDFDLFTKPLITINYAGKSTTMMAPSKTFYDNVEDMDDVTTGDHTWSAYSCESMGQKLYMLFEDQGVIQFQAAVGYETDGGSISLSDADVQAILSSIAPTNKEDIAAASQSAAAPEPSEPAGEDPKPDDPKPEEPAPSSDDGESKALAMLRGDWNGAFAMRNCTGNFGPTEGLEQAAIARFSVDILDNVRTFIGICVEDLPFEDLSVEYNAKQGCYLLSGKWNSCSFADVPIKIANGTLSVTVPIDAGDFGSLDIIINLRRLDDTGWTNEDPRLSQSNIEFCMGKTFDELAELVGYSFEDYPSEDKG